jgi:hypothetical protein
METRGDFPLTFQGHIARLPTVQGVPAGYALWLMSLLDKVTLVFIGH